MKKDWWKSKRVTWRIEWMAYPEIQPRFWWDTWNTKHMRGLSIGLFFFWVTRTEVK